MLIKINIDNEEMILKVEDLKMFLHEKSASKAALRAILNYEDTVKKLDLANRKIEQLHDKLDDIRGFVSLRDQYQSKINNFFNES